MAKGQIQITSSAFNNNETIPKKYTCDGNGSDISPALSWTGVPEGTKSLVLIVDDPDAPKKTWVHWIVFNIPPIIKGFEEDVDIGKINAKQGTNDFNKLTYGGPCPPSGRHRYFFKLYALDTLLDLPDGATKNDVEAAMEGHILDQSELIGLYSRK